MVILLDDNRYKLKKQAKTKAGLRQYADPKSTLLNHPTRAKILEALSEGPKTTTELQTETQENRINLYYHLNTLESEGMIEYKIEHREKIFRLRKLNSTIALAHQFRLIPPKNKDQYDEFISILETLFKKADRIIPDFNPHNIKQENLESINITFDQLKI